MRIRTIKPEFFTHEGLFEAEKAEGLPLRIAFVGLWCAADREGRFKWEPRRLGVAILPYDGIEFSRVLDALVTRGFVVKYRVGADWFGEIPSFRRHQVVNHRESASALPQLAEAEETVDASATRDARVRGKPGHASGEGKGKEGKEGKEGNGSSAATTRGDGSAPVQEPAPEPKPRPRNPLFDALAAATDGPADKLTSATARSVGVALAEIRKVHPDLTADEIERRAANYRAHFRDAVLTAAALAKHWARCDSAPRATASLTTDLSEAEFKTRFGDKF